MIKVLQEHSLTQNDIVLLAALELSKGDINQKFTAEELLIKSWKLNIHAFGLRGFENQYPDSNILYTKLMGKSGLVRTGFLKKIGGKTYTITEAGLTIASSLKPVENETKLKINRQLHDAVIKIINHEIFYNWLKTSGEEPKKFRDAMWFWGIAPGTPPKIVKERISVIERNLQQAKKRAESEGGKITIESRNLSKQVKNNLKEQGHSTVDERTGHLFLDIKDINMCLEFHNTIKDRFGKELDYMLKTK